MTQSTVGAAAASTADLLLRAQLSWRLRREAPLEWREFAVLWMAFNALYGVRGGRSERARVISTVRMFLREHDALGILERCQQPINAIGALPPGDMRRASSDPRFRMASEEDWSTYRKPSASPQERLAAVTGLLYQVRCNLLHGSKDPSNDRDRMLVAASVDILNALLPALEAGIGVHGSELAR